jgi:hypothetical protein
MTLAASCINRNPLLLVVTPQNKKCHLSHYFVDGCEDDFGFRRKMVPLL